ncbi:MAG TPA: DUF6069 family protein [Symbiobacteriaceae bacterium]|nr:DUF6069 family protein [Symbiobacteriaceae bacterium]
MKGILRAGVVAGLVSVVGNLLVWALSKFVAGADFVVAFPGQAPMEVPVFMVALETFVPILLAALGLALLAKLMKQPVLTFQVIAGILAVLSIAGPIGVTATTATKVGLALMHVVAGILVLYIPKLAK